MTDDQTTEAAPSVLRPASSAPRRIRLCADDYGISAGVNSAIRDLIVRGRLNATSVMVAAPSFARAEARSLAILNSGAPRAAIGLHVTLTAPFRPLSKGFRPLLDGAFPPLPALMRSALLRRLSGEPIAAEIEAQLAAFAAAFGRAPDFIDGHQHVHLLPQLREEVLAAAKRRAPRPSACRPTRPLPEPTASGRTPTSRDNSRASWTACRTAASSCATRATWTRNSSGSTRSPTYASGNMPICAATLFRRRLPPTARPWPERGQRSGKMSLRRHYVGSK
jgi:hypothetical protein